MHHHLPADEPATERVLLIQLEPMPSWGGDCRHLSARVLRKAKMTMTNPDTGREEYSDGKNATGYRNCTWSNHKANAVYVEDFVLRCQMTVRDWNGNRGERKVYGSDYKFRDIHDLDRRVVKHMNETFRKVDAGMAKLQEQFGYCSDDDFAALCSRVAAVLGIKNIVVWRKEKVGTSYETDNLLIFPISYASSVVDRMVDEVYPKVD